MPMPQPRSGKPKATDNPSRVAATECSPQLKPWVILNRVDLLSAGQLGATPSGRRLTRTAAYINGSGKLTRWAAWLIWPIPSPSHRGWLALRLHVWSKLGDYECNRLDYKS